MQGQKVLNIIKMQTMTPSYENLVCAFRREDVLVVTITDMITRQIKMVQNIARHIQR